MLNSFNDAYEEESSITGKDIIKQLIENARIAKSESMPICQDTGYTVIFLEIGQDVYFEGGSLEEAINEGVRKGYSEGYLRKSIVSHPLDRINTGDNTPAVIHTRIVTGDNFKITVVPKGGGSENVSAVKMLKPAQGAEGVMDFVVKTVKEAGPNPCPPIIVGVGIGGTFEKAALLAKESLLRPLGQPSKDDYGVWLEQELLERINKLGIGPQGLGGSITALAVHVNFFPAHIASLPVAVNINCHASRHKKVEL